MTSKRSGKQAAKSQATEKSEKGRDSLVVTEAEKKLSIAEKLELLENEFCLLRDMCLQSGYSGDQIQSAASPFLASIKKAKRKNWTRRALHCFLSLLLAYTLFSYDPVYRLLSAYGRKTSIHLLPLWDWTTMYDRECLVVNPYFKGQELKEEDCEVCESFDTIPRVKNINSSDVVEKFLNHDKPFIVTDGIEPESLSENFTIKYLDQLYRTHPVLRMYSPCSFRSNLRTKFEEQKIFLKKAAAGDISSYYAHWENCFISAAKVLREHYTRPAFLPPVVQMDNTNWVYISSGFKGKTYKPIDMITPLVILAQIKGEINFILQPREPCSGLCSELTGTLHQGEILLVVSFLWDLEYLPSSELENISIGMGATYDFF